MTDTDLEKKIQVLAEWKKAYIEALIDLLKPSGDVLEVGFGNGTAAERIQLHHPKTLTILEADPGVFEEAKRWASKHPQVKVLHGKWETLLPTLGSFDTLYYDDYPVEYEASLISFLFPEEALQASNQTKHLLELMAEQMAQLTMQFTDSDIEEFYEKIGQFNSKDLPFFFQKLRENGNVTQAQYDSVVKKYQLKDIAKTVGSKASDSSASDRMVAFLEECLKQHMNKGARFTCFLNSAVSKYEDSRFFENIITNPDADYKETTLPVTITDGTRNALLILVQK